MTIRQHLHLIPATLALGLSLLATSPAQSEDTQEQPPSETINSQTRLENNLKAVIAYYQELENQLSKATTEAEAKNIWRSMLRKMPEGLQGGSFISTDLQDIPLQKQKRILAPYRHHIQNLHNALVTQCKRLGFDYQYNFTDGIEQMRAIYSFTEEWECLVQQYPEESDAAELFQQHLARLDNAHKLLASIRTPNDRQRVEEIIAAIQTPDDSYRVIDPQSWTYNSPQNSYWVDKLQATLQKLPADTQKRLYITYLPLTHTSLPPSPEKASGQYHYLVYQSEPLLQYLSLRYQEQYMLQKAQENITEQKQDNFPADMPEKEILIRQNIALTNQLSNLLSEITGKAAAAAAGPRAYDLKNRLLENRELLICSDDVSPEEQTLIDRAYGEHLQQATDELNRQVQRLASKKTYRNNDLSDIVAELSPEQKPQQQNNATPAADQTEKAQQATDEN